MKHSKHSSSSFLFFFFAGNRRLNCVCVHFFLLLCFPVIPVSFVPNLNSASSPFAITRHLCKHRTQPCHFQLCSFSHPSRLFDSLLHVPPSPPRLPVYMEHNYATMGGVEMSAVLRLSPWTAASVYHWVPCMFVRELLLACVCACLSARVRTSSCS